MNATIGWAMAALALVAGYMGYGWPGVLLALTVTVFWLLMQFSRAVRTMKRAAERPLGTVDSAVMLHSKLHAGMGLAEILKLSGSLGRKVSEGSEPESFAWRDGGDDEVVIELKGGQLTAWRLQRGDALS